VAAEAGAWLEIYSVPAVMTAGTKLLIMQVILMLEHYIIF